MNINNKLTNLASVAKPFKHENMFVLLQDHDGWSNGYFADLLGYNIDKIQADARIKSTKDKNFRFNIDKDTCPKILPVLPVGDQKELTDIEYDLEDMMAWLISDDLKVKINPSYYKYFATNYKPLGPVYLKLTELDKPVTVWLNDSMIGLIMPIKI